MTEEKRLLEVVPPEGNPEDETCLTFVLNEEDHTLGNALRYVIMKNPEVQFCGYNIPHPSEKKINLRIQTEGVSAKDVLTTGLRNLNAACEHILGTFEQSVTDYKSSLEERESGERDPDEQSSSSEGEDEDVAMEEDSDDD